MNLSVAKDQLIHGLQSVQNIVSTRTTLPILSNVLMRAGENKLEFTATDLDVSIACSVEATVKKKGASTVPVKRFFNIVRELASPEIELEVDEKNACSVRAGASFYKINGLSADEFPPVQSLKEDKKITLPQEKFRGMLRKTSFAISSDESRYVLNGIFISLKEHKMTMVATDGRRLALVDEEVDIPETSQGEFILHTQGRQRFFGPDYFQTGGGQLPQLPPSHSRRDQGAHRAAAGRASGRHAPGANHDQRQGQFGQDSRQPQ